MSTARIICPQCQAPLKFIKAPAPGKSIRCPGCQLNFMPPDAAVAEPAARRGLAILCGVMMCIGLGGIAAWRFGRQSGDDAALAPDVTAASSSMSESQPQAAPLPAPSAPPITAGAASDMDSEAPTAKKPKTYAESKRPAGSEAPPALAAISTTGDAHPLQDRINAAIDKGIAYLVRTQAKSGSWTDGSYQAGYAALGGLTLLEGGLAADHPAVQRAAACVRSTPIGNHRTYQVALAVLFLDRLGDPRDEPLIQMLGLQLIAGHNERGAWGYECPVLTPQQAQQLLLALQKNQPKLPSALGKDAKSALKAPLGKNDAARQPEAPRQPEAARQAEPPRDPRSSLQAFANEAKKRRQMFPNIQAPVLQMPAGPNHPFLDIPELNFLVRREDNSNTQFALMALWAARRHGVPAERSLILAAHGLAATQNSDGGWGYNSFGMQSGTTPAMTCVGLLGLAMGHGLLSPAAEKDAPPADPRIAAGLKQLGSGIAGGNLRNLYFLWSLERVAVLYNLRTIGNKDWYDLGARSLLDAQEADGHWSMGYYFGSSPPLDTCFAVLFLRRSNLVRDLSERLPLFMAITDPDARTPPAPERR
jgi:hypothetical protein